jgi:hypothetical protein
MPCVSREHLWKWIILYQKGWQKSLNPLDYRVGFVSPKKIAELIDVIETSQFFFLEDSYMFHATDLPATTTMIILDDQIKTIYNYGGRCGSAYSITPVAVCKVQDTIDEIAGTERWIAAK